MSCAVSFAISWGAPIVPSVSLAGVPLHAAKSLLMSVLATYVIDEDRMLYKFDGSPVLRLRRGLDEGGDDLLCFSLNDDDLIHKFNKGIPALIVMIRDGKVFAVKAYDFSFPGEPVRDFVYKGVFQNGIGLGSLVSDILKFTDLEFDEAEEWFYADASFGGVEITGYGVPLEDEPEQVITAICVIP